MEINCRVFPKDPKPKTKLPAPCPSLLLPAQHQDSSGRGQSHLRLSTPILLQKRLLDPPKAQQGHSQCIFYLCSERNINTK